MNIKSIFQSATLAMALGATTFALPDRAQAGPNPYIGELMIVGFNFCPRGWIAAEGQLLAINSYQALFSLYGTNYGGDGRTSFGMPDLRGRVAIGEGSGPGLPFATLGAKSGAEQEVMTEAKMPSHNHAVNANNLDGDKAGPGGKLLAAAPTGGAGNETIYSTSTANKTMAATMITSTGNGAAFSIQDPKLGLLHCVSTEGLFPSRN